MKLNVGIISTIAFLFGSSVYAMDVSLGDGWDGKTVPSGQQCQKFGGNNPATPTISLNGVPSGTVEIVLEYSDRSYQKMDNGGHGKMSYSSNIGTDTIVPPVPGHTFDLPVGFKCIEAHRSPKWDIAGAYMPPCSGGKGHEYYVTIKAIDSNGDSLDTTTVELGNY